MTAVRDFAAGGGPVIGICNGFQVLTEAHLLPGALLPNATLRFHSHRTHIRYEGATSPWLADLQKGDVLNLVVAHGQGSYFVDGETLKRLEDNNQIAFRYVEQDGSLTDEANLNGSVDAIAGVVNEAGNVLGLMPHPERVVEPAHGGRDGRRLFEGLLDALG